MSGYYLSQKDLDIARSMKATSDRYKAADSDRADVTSGSGYSRYDEEQEES